MAVGMCLVQHLRATYIIINLSTSVYDDTDLRVSKKRTNFESHARPEALSQREAGLFVFLFRYRARLP